MASEFVRKITDTTTSEPINKTTTSGDFIITKDDKVLINLNGTLKDLTPVLTTDEFNELKVSIKKNADETTRAESALDKKITDETTRAKDEEARLDKKLDDEVVHNTGNETITGTKTFTEGVSLNGKNVVNGITDTDWLDIPLAEGRTGTAKYKVSLGKVFIHIDGVKGITATGNNAQGQIGTLPANPIPYYTRYTVLAGSTSRTVTITSTGVIYVSYTLEDTMSENDLYMLDTVLM